MHRKRKTKNQHRKKKKNSKLNHWLPYLQNMAEESTAHRDTIVIYYLKGLEVKTLGVAAANCDIRQQIVLLKMHTRCQSQTLKAQWTRQAFSAVWMSRYGSMVECVLCVCEVDSPGKIRREHIKWMRVEDRREEGRVISWWLRKARRITLALRKWSLRYSAGPETGHDHART